MQLVKKEVNGLKDYEALSRKHFDGQAAEYDQRDTYYYSRNGKISCRDIAEHIRNVPYEALLDVGYGTGLLIDLLTDQKTAQYCGLDLSEEMVRVARGKEIFFSGQAGIANPSHLPAGWYWLDNVYSGAKAANKEVYMPYTINGQDNIGKWVRYDGTGQMIKGWYSLNGKRYFYDVMTGAMFKGNHVIDGRNYYFDDTTGVLR